MKYDSVVSFSGGLDSTVLASLCLNEGKSVLAISFNYGQRHSKELSAAQKVVHRLTPRGMIHWIILDVRTIGKTFELLGSMSSLINSTIDVPEGHYSHSSMQKTVVPNRNMIFLSILTGMAISVDAREVAIACHNGDSAIYPDCRPAFLATLEAAIEMGNEELSPIFKLYAPFIKQSKTNIVEIGNMIDAPMALSWSCYTGGEVHCSKCGTCYERREAFEDAGVDDPTPYAITREEWEEWKANDPSSRSR
jgi:7-cyano-7-deazaguanine synthase